MSRLRAWLPILAAGLAAAVLYAATLMVVPTGCQAEYCADVGEFQIALAAWGTAHATGYPLYMLFGSPFVAALRQLGLPPAAGASAFSLVWEAAAVAGAALVIYQLTHGPLLALAGGLVVAVFEPVWVHGTLAEVYSLSLLFVAALLGLTIQLRQDWSDAGGWLLAFVAGLGVAHHRLIGVLLPVVALVLIGPAWRGRNFWRWLAVAFVCFLAGFVPYLDSPLRVWRGSTWNYGQPQTWNGFWFIFWGSEAGDQRVPILSGLELVHSAASVVREMVRLTTWPGLIGSVALGAAALRERSRRPVAWLLIGGMAAYLAFAVVFHRAVLLAADLMPVLLMLVVMAALGLCALPRAPRLAGIVGLFAWAGWLGVANAPVVVALTRDPRGADLITQVERLPIPPGAIIMQPWGPAYFPLAYAARVEGRFPQWTIVDHRADLGALAATAGAIYTRADTPYEFGLDWWASRLGRPLRVASAGAGWIEFSSRPLPGPSHTLQPLGEGMALESCEVMAREGGRQIVVTANWVATQPAARDYSSYAYASDQDAIAAPGDLVAQSDFTAPVYGWYPTSQWQPGEVVRDDHLLEVPPDRTVRTIFVGMYSRNAAGGFDQLGRLRLTETNGDCTTEPVPAVN